MIEESIATLPVLEAFWHGEKAVPVAVAIWGQQIHFSSAVPQYEKSD